ncbi:MAG TPA: hypothetical protein VGO35_01185 [Gammaproteobacteria bacterium]|jgi:hypothetical protein|nr:hypothetical protein [Gammaproteobacteria bacterium]
MASGIKHIFERDHVRYEGVRRINIYLLRTLYFLMATMLAYDVWSYTLGHRGPWENKEGIAWSVWAGFSTLAILGVFHPLKMIPILLLEIFYKSLWLILVAYPLWKAGTLTGSPAEGTFYVFIPVVIVYLIMPWGYVFRTYVLGRA